jgi:DNA-binding MarR family transcriptional regulator
MNPLQLLEQINTLDLHFRTLFFNKVSVKSTEYGLKPTMARCLIVLYFNPNAPMHEIAMKLDIEKGSLTPIAKKLEHLGLVQRVVQPEDNRVHVMKLTASGNKQAKIILESYIEHIQEVFNSMSVEVRMKLQETIAQLNEILAHVEQGQH